MKRNIATRQLTFLFLGVVLTIIFSASGCQQDTVQKAQLVITGKIFTGIDSSPFVEALAVADGKILAIGNEKEIKKYAGPETKVIGLKDGVAIPGLIDAHTHFSSGGRSLIELSFRGIDSVENFSR